MTDAAVGGALAAATVGLTAVVTGVVLRYAGRHLLDLPDDRSSHLSPTPSSGGLGAVIGFLVALGFVAARFPRSAGVWAALGVSVALAAVGFVDDVRPLPATPRFLVHGVSAAVAIALIGGMPDLDLGTWRLHVGWIGVPIAWVVIVWFVNLNNFMDGLDGLAGGQAVVVAAAMAGLLWLGDDRPLSLAALALSAAAGGFLVWNWPPAKIFMGDVGSGFFGFCIAVLAVAGQHRGSLPLLAVFLLMGVFLVDATATLLARAVAGERWYEPHRTHAYQVATRLDRSHARVTVVVLAIDLVLAASTFAAHAVPRLLLPLWALSVSLLLAVWWQVRRRGTSAPSA